MKLIYFLIIILPIIVQSQICNKVWSGYFQGYEGGFINNCNSLNDFNKWFNIFRDDIEVLDFSNNFSRGNNTYICYSLVLFRSINPFLPLCTYFDR